MSTRANTGAATTYGLHDYVGDIEAILDRRPALPLTIREVSAVTRKLVSNAAWLDPAYRIASKDHYARHLLHRDRLNRFVVLSLVWLPGQCTPVHDHSCWGVMGVLENVLEEVHYVRLDDGSRPDYAELRESAGMDVSAGSTGYVLPPYEEIHRIGNTTDRPSISIHVYGRDLHEVNVFDTVTNKVSPMRIKYYGQDCGNNDFMI